MEPNKPLGRAFLPTCRQRYGNFWNFEQRKGKISLVGDGASALRPGVAGLHRPGCGIPHGSGRHAFRTPSRHAAARNGRPTRCPRTARPEARTPLAPRTPRTGPRRPGTGAPQPRIQQPDAGGARLGLLLAGRFAGGPKGRLAGIALRLRHDPQPACRTSVPRRPALGQEHRLTGLRRAQQAGLRLQRGRRNLPEPEPEGRLHADRHGHEADLRLRKARLGGRQVDGHQTRVHRGRNGLPDGYDHLQPRHAEGQDQGRGHAAGRRMAGGRQREEDARQHLQHRARQVHHLRPNRPPALLPGHDQGKGDSREKGGHRTGLPGHGGRADLFPRHTRGLLPDQHGPQVGSADAHLRRGDLQGILPPRPGLLHHAGRICRPGAPRRILHARLVGGLGRLALHQAIQVQRQLQRGVLERKDRRKGRTRLHQAEQLPRAVDPLAGCQGQSRIDLLGLGELRHQRPPTSTTSFRRRPTRRSPTRRAGAEPPSRSRQTWPSRRTRRTSRSR